MGYLPKHIKVRRHNATIRLIATAALAGAEITRVVHRRIVRLSNLGRHLPIYELQHDNWPKVPFSSRSKASQAYMDRMHFGIPNWDVERAMQYGGRIYRTKYEIINAA